MGAHDMQSGLTFEQETHTYKVGGVVVPSVTQLLSCASSFGFLSPEDLMAAQDRGTYIHAMCEADDLEDLDEEVERTREHWPRLLAWRQFCQDFGANWELIEGMSHSKRFGYAGTLDRAGRLEKHSGEQCWIIDIKSSMSKSRVWGLQLAAYRQMLSEHNMQWALARRACVRLLADGTYRFDEFKSPKDWPAFQSIITLTDWKNNG